MPGFAFIFPLARHAHRVVLACALLVPGAFGQTESVGGRGSGLGPAAHLAEGPMRHKVFFPPNPPPFGVEVQMNRRGEAAERVPEQLAAYVAEPFYAPLSTRLWARKMTPELETMLADFTRVRRALRQELLDHLYGVKDGDTATRLQLNLEFARTQTPRVVAMEAVAEELRTALYRARRFGASELDWNALRQWKLGRSALKRPREENLLLEYQVVRAAVFYQEGLSPAQRRLLREIAMDLEDTVFRRGSSSMSDFGFVFFSPDTMRMRFPSGLPQEAVALLEGYDAAKSALKTEIRDRLYELDSVYFVSSRTKELELLIAPHQPRIDALEGMAEDIRRELVDMPALKRPAPPALVPEELESMIGEYQSSLRKFQQGLVRRVVQARREIPPPPPGDPAAALEWREKIAERTEAATEAYAAEHVQALTDLKVEVEAIAASLEHLVSGEEALLIAGAPEHMLANFLRLHRKALSAFELHTAVLEPGLSPEQRRLLLGMALETMELPLPGGEWQPTSLPGTFIPLDQIGK